MQDEEIKEKYASIQLKAKMITVVFIALISPRLVLGFTDLEVFLGLNYVSALAPMAIGTIIYSIFVYKFWRCPACNKFPGGGWSRKACKKCNVALC